MKKFDEVLEKFVQSKATQMYKKTFFNGYIKAVEDIYLSAKRPDGNDLCAYIEKLENWITDDSAELSPPKIELDPEHN